MKAQFVILFVVMCLALAFECYAAPPPPVCNIVLQGQFTHQTGDGNSGCFGLDSSDPISSITLGKATTKWTFFSDFGCKGTVVDTGVGDKKFATPIAPNSVLLACP
ncbi:4697_t:CDS:2 [Paraglomus brasilianum]|uniref:4697_t:CDS:1 n=1 Tax=Paraglomus brasilianum TaxID=144538 RepID=A0A9N9F5G6_9GLOM|nr:4697_t:CDS:2 [Paraglomus brasilianum]